MVVRCATRRSQLEDHQVLRQRADWGRIGVWDTLPVMTTSVVAVSAESFFLAESKIRGCINCCRQSLTLTTKFERLLDSITGLPETTMYILPAVARCPACHNRIFESTMVVPSILRKRIDLDEQIWKELERILGQKPQRAQESPRKSSDD